MPEAGDPAYRGGELLRLRWHQRARDPRGSAAATSCLKAPARSRRGPFASAALGAQPAGPRGPGERFAAAARLCQRHRCTTSAIRRCRASHAPRPARGGDRRPMPRLPDRAAAIRGARAAERFTGGRRGPIGRIRDRSSCSPAWGRSGGPWAASCSRASRCSARPPRRCDELFQRLAGLVDARARCGRTRHSLAITARPRSPSPPTSCCRSALPALVARPGVSSPRPSSATASARWRPPMWPAS